MLSHGDARTPTLPHHELSLGATEVGTTATVTLTLPNEGEALLRIPRLAVLSDPGLCPSASAAFVITEPSLSAGEISLAPATGPT